MLTNEVVLNVFADYLRRDSEYEVVLTSRGYTVMGWDNYAEEWYFVKLCPTPETLRDTLLHTYRTFRVMELTNCGKHAIADKDLPSIDAECKILAEKCERMGIEMLT